MFILYGLLLLMLLIALVIIAVPFVTKKPMRLGGYLIIVLLTFLFAFGFYQFSGNKQALYQWLTVGRQHYKLLETFNKLGGVDGAISRITAKLIQEPNDAEGWFILGKLYLSKEDTIRAEAAFSKAHELAPDNQKITHFYEVTKNKTKK